MQLAEGRLRFGAERTRQFTESVIREMTRLAVAHKAVNLAQGFPDFPAPEIVKQAACDAITRNINQYAITWGARPFRQAIATKTRDWYAIDVDPEREVTVCCGSTEGMIASLLAVTNPGDEIVMFEPFYENYGPDAHLSGADRRIVPLYPPDWTFDREELRRAFGERTKAIILNSPNNPTGRVFSREELLFIASLCQEFDALAITDEIYEHIIYDGVRHVPMMTLPGMRERTITINSMSKTYAVTGWRVGWVIAPPDLTDSIRKVHDFLTVGAAAPLQQAGTVALGLPRAYYIDLARHYTDLRDRTLAMLEAAGFRCFRPSGAYYIMTDITGFGAQDDVSFIRHMIQHAGVAAVPGSSFFADPVAGSRFVRFCFCKKYETLDEAGSRLARLQQL
jgi:aspartate/methionine/tyrosine aminotransferase